MSTGRIEIYVAPNGSRWADGSRGYPVSDLASAMTLARMRREPGQRVVVWVESGTYLQSAPLILTAEDSFTTFAARQPSDPPVFLGARVVENWSQVTVNDSVVWAAPAPVSEAITLYVDGLRWDRPRYPAVGYLRMASQEGLDPAADFVGTLLQGSSEFEYFEGDMPELLRPTDVEVVVPHYWVQERMPVVEIDRNQRIVKSSRRSIFALRDDADEQFARFWLDNVADEFGNRPGEWYLDRDGELSGLDGDQVLAAFEPGESPNKSSVVMPVNDSFVQLLGTELAPVREVRFEHISFEYGGFAATPPSVLPFGVREDPMLDPNEEYAADVQAASSVPGAIRLEHAKDCALVNCSVRKVDGYAIDLRQGCVGNLISGCLLEDLGAGGIRCGGSIDSASKAFNRANTVSDNHVRSGGRIYPNCVAIIFQHGADNVIAHNHVEDFFYTGISVGWMWDYLDSPSTGNTIAGNLIHNLGQGVLNDMGGVYLLGIAPGTVVRDNHIYDVECKNYGGWGIYLDEGSSHVVIEGNLVHDVSSNAYHHHYGAENIIRHNIFAFGESGQISITRPENLVAFTMERNIIVGHSTPGYMGYAGHQDVSHYGLVSDLNLFWDYKPLTGAVRAGVGERIIADGEPTRVVLVAGRDKEWAGLGHDRHSLTADPQFMDIGERDFQLGPDSPAHALGIRSPNVSEAGPRGQGHRKHPLAYFTVKDDFPRPIG